MSVNVGVDVGVKVEIGVSDGWGVTVSVGNKVGWTVSVTVEGRNGLIVQVGSIVDVGIGGGWIAVNPPHPMENSRAADNAKTAFFKLSL